MSPEDAPGTGPDGGEPAVVVVCGPPGVGKSRVARTVADRLGAGVYRTDVIRKELFGDPTYATGETERVYAALRRRALAAVDRGQRAVLDGTYRREQFRTAVREAVVDRGGSIRFVRVECDREVVRDRIADRAGGPSDATFEDHLAVAEAFDPIELPHARVDRVDNSGKWARTRRRIAEILG